MNTYMSGSLVRVTGTYTNAAGADADPTAATLKYRAGTGITQTVTPVKDSTGVYHYDIDTSGWAGPGSQVYVYQFSGTGTVQAIQASAFEVEAPAL